MQELMQLIDEALERRGWSDRQASIEATGGRSLIMNMRRGRRPTIDRLSALCDVLGLEFYVGWPRTVPGADLDVERLALALETVAAEFPRAETRLSVPDRAQLLAAVYGVLIENDPPAAAARARELIAIARRFGVADAVRE